MPSQLSLTTSVQSPKLRRCYVPAKGARHKVSAWNYGLLPYLITIHGECETENVRYNGTAETPGKIWDAHFWVPGRPGMGRRGKNGRAKPLTSQGKGENETIRVDLTW